MGEFGNLALEIKALTIWLQPTSIFKSNRLNMNVAIARILDLLMIVFGYLLRCMKECIFVMCFIKFQDD